MGLFSPSFNMLLSVGILLTLVVSVMLSLCVCSGWAVNFHCSWIAVEDFIWGLASDIHFELWHGRSCFRVLNCWEGVGNLYIVSWNVTILTD